MTEGLLRQRRNLLIVCIVLWFTKYAGVTINKASFAGFDVEIKNMEALFTALWLAFAYFLYRYYQYFASEGPPKIAAAFINGLDEKCQPHIQRIVAAANGNHGGGATLSWNIIRKRGWSFPGMSEEQDEIGQVIRKNLEIPIKPWGLKRPMTSSVFDTVFRNSVLTDYLLPFGVAVWVIWYGGQPNWNGSFIHLLLA